MTTLPTTTRGRPMSAAGRSILGAYMVLLPILLGYLLVVLWPTAKADATGNIPDSNITLFGLIHFSVSSEIQLILIVMIVASLGSYIHAATSFADYAGNRQLTSSWVWWYVLRVLIGLSLAVLFYFVLRGGLLSAGASSADLSPYGIAGAAGLVGMFSKQATDKLREVFETLFNSEREPYRADPLNHGAIAANGASLPQPATPLVQLPEGADATPAAPETAAAHDHN